MDNGPGHFQARGACVKFTDHVHILAIKGVGLGLWLQCALRVIILVGVRPAVNGKDGLRVYTWRFGQRSKLVIFVKFGEFCLDSGGT